MKNKSLENLDTANQKPTNKKLESATLLSQEDLSNSLWVNSLYTEVNNAYENLSSKEEIEIYIDKVVSQIEKAVSLSTEDGDFEYTSADIANIASTVKDIKNVFDQLCVEYDIPFTFSDRLSQVEENLVAAD